MERPKSDPTAAFAEAASTTHVRPRRLRGTPVANISRNQADESADARPLKPRNPKNGASIEWRRGQGSVLVVGPVPDGDVVGSLRRRGLAAEPIARERTADVLRGRRYDGVIVFAECEVDAVHRVRSLREIDPLVGILVVSPNIRAEVPSLLAGADDFLSQETDGDVLYARTIAVLRRTGASPEPRIALRGRVFGVERERVILTRKQRLLIAAVLTANDAAVSSAELMASSGCPTPRAVDEQFRRVALKLAAFGYGWRLQRCGDGSWRFHRGAPRR